MVGINKSCTLSSRATVEQALRCLNAGHKTVVVLDEKSRVVGSVTDGDVRRAMLKGAVNSSVVGEIMNCSPIITNGAMNIDEVICLAKERGVIHIIEVNEKGEFVGLITSQAYVDRKMRALNASALIMAGGKGKRLLPITNSLPKPMVVIGGKPLLQRQIERLRDHGITEINISVNYLSHVIENYFNDGAQFGVTIHYLREKEEMGSGGALRLLDKNLDQNLVVINGDVLTDLDFHELCQFHETEKADITVAGTRHEIYVPFGILNVSGNELVSVDEKPMVGFLCNAGIYVVSPGILQWAKEGSGPMTMVDVIEHSLAMKKVTRVFAAHEEWTDIGTPEDLASAQEQFEFKK